MMYGTRGTLAKKTSNCYANWKGIVYYVETWTQEQKIYNKLIQEIAISSLKFTQPTYH